MGWWSIFHKVRKIIFAFIVVISLASTITLSFFLAKEWSLFGRLQRGIVLSMIVVDAITVIVQYLMIVMVFKIWPDLARTLFLLLIHISTSVLYTIFNVRFDCVIFGSVSFCRDADLAFFVGTWVMTALLLLHTVFLLLVTRIRKPDPEITPNLLLHTDRRTSGSSFGSNTVTGTTPATSAEGGEKGGLRAVTESQPILMPDGSPMPFPPPSRASMHFGSGGNYGAMGLPPTLGISRASSFRSLPLSRPPSRMRQASFSPRVQAYGENIVSPPQPLRVPNPFWDPATRVRTPDSAYVAATYGAPAAGEKLSGYFSPSQDTPLYTSIRSPPMAPVPSTPPSPSSSISLYADEDEDRTFGSTSPILTSSLAYLSPYDPRVKSTISPSPPRTNTPSSLHSVAPSVHFANPMSRPPLPASPRAMNGPLSRSYTASPRLSHSPEAHLPTPFPPVARAATLHRYASINNAIGTGQNTSIGSPRNALYHQGMMGQDMDITSSPAYRNSPYSAGIGSGMNNTRWRQLVMNAANSR